ncbi:MAG: hypothetical protein AAGC54_06500, partial [Cyanobacteria bacterium P01_F01_bin.4]
GSGAGLGGAIFIRSGSLILNQVRFEHNVAIAGTGSSPGQGKGGALFITPKIPLTQTVAKVIVLGELPEFLDNTASDAAGIPTDNHDVYGAIAHSELDPSPLKELTQGTTNISAPRFRRRRKN